MSLKLYFHPLASFCHKALIALYENGVPFEPVIVDLGDAASSAAFRKVWPMAKMPGSATTRVTAPSRNPRSSSNISTSITRAQRALCRPIPTAPGRPGCGTAFTISMCRSRCRRSSPTGCGPPAKMTRMASSRQKCSCARPTRRQSPCCNRKPGRWAMILPLADCAAAPALFYANTVLPFGAAEQNLSAYLHRLMARPSFARVLAEAEPYFKLFPMEEKPRIAGPR